MPASRIALLAASVGLLAGCHWLFGHTLGAGSEDGAGRDRAIRDGARNERTSADVLGEGPARDHPMTWPGDLARHDAKKLSDKNLIGGDSVTPSPLGPACTQALLIGGKLTDQAGQVIIDGINGNIYLAGTFRDTLSFGGVTRALGNGAGVLAAYTSALGYRWDAPTGGATASGVTLSQSTTAMTVGNGVAAADPQIQVTQFDTGSGISGAAVQLGAIGEDAGNAIAVAGSTLVVAGAYSAMFPTAGMAVDHRGSGLDALLLEVDQGGSASWGIGFGSAGLDEALAVASRSPTIVFLGGRYSNGCWFGPGDPSVPGSSLGSAFVVKVDTRAVAWSFPWGSTGASATLALAAEPTGGVYAAGYFSGTIMLAGKSLTANKKDLILVKLDSAGKPQWWVQGKGAGDDEATGLGLDAAGNLYLIGTTGSGSLALESSESSVSQTLTVIAPPDPILASYTSAGFHRWSRAIEGSGTQRGKSLAVSAMGQLVVAGETEQGFAPGGACGWLVSKGSSDVFLLTLK